MRRVVKVNFCSQQDLAVLNLPFVMAAHRKIGMVVVDDITCGYQLARMEQGGIALGRFINNRLSQIFQATSGLKLTLMYVKKTQFLPKKAKLQWDPKVSIAVTLSRNDNQEVEAVMETSEQKTCTILCSDVFRSTKNC